MLIRWRDEGFWQGASWFETESQTDKRNIVIQKTETVLNTLIRHLFNLDENILFLWPKLKQSTIKKFKAN